jgi:magnesium chelatase family protein
MLVATMNPCPCGYLGDPAKECSCTASQILAYQKRLSGPLLDRIDLTLTVNRVQHRDLLQSKSMQKSQQISAVQLINTAVKRQNERYKSSTKYNSNLTSSEVSKLLTLTEPAKQLLLRSAEKLDLSARSYFKIIKVARTIADLADAPIIDTAHIGEALQFRGTIKP